MSSGSEPRRRSEEQLAVPDFSFTEQVEPVERFDGYPTDADTVMIRVLQDTVRQVQAWATVAYVDQPTPERTLDLAAVLGDTVHQLTEYAEDLARRSSP